MKKLFELPELFTLSGSKLTSGMSFTDILEGAGGNSCGSGSGSGNTCSNGSGDGNSCSTGSGGSEIDS